MNGWRGGYTSHSLPLPIERHRSVVLINDASDQSQYLVSEYAREWLNVSVEPCGVSQYHNNALSAYQPQHPLLIFACPAQTRASVCGCLHVSVSVNGLSAPGGTPPYPLRLFVIEIFFAANLWQKACRGFSLSLYNRYTYNFPSFCFSGPINSAKINKLLGSNKTVRLYISRANFNSYVCVNIGRL